MQSGEPMNERWSNSVGSNPTTTVAYYSVMEAGWSKLYTEHLKYRFACGLDAVKHLEYVIVDIAIQNQKSSPTIG